MTRHQKAKLSLTVSCESNSSYSSISSTESSNQALKSPPQTENPTTSKTSDYPSSDSESLELPRQSDQHTNNKAIKSQKSLAKEEIKISSQYVAVCSVCNCFITEKDVQKSSNITPHPRKVHGHCWLHITTKDCPIPWPRNLPRIPKEAKSEQLPTIRKIQKLYNFMTTGISGVSGAAKF